MSVNLSITRVGTSRPPVRTPLASHVLQFVCCSCYDLLQLW